jgi:hypothetical protein
MSIWDEIHTNPRLHGEIGLWLVVIIDAYETVLTDDKNNEARHFLLDQNEIFDIVALALEYDDPEILRKRIREALERRGCQRVTKQPPRPHGTKGRLSS